MTAQAVTAVPRSFGGPEFGLGVTILEDLPGLVRSEVRVLAIPPSRIGGR